MTRSLFFLLALPGLSFGAKLNLPPGQLPADDLFKDGVIPRVRLELSSSAMDALKRHPRTYVSGIVREGAVTYTNVSIRLKGGPGSFRPLEDRPAFTVNFGRLAPGQSFHGLKKLHLNNSVQDSTYLSEKICREMFEAAGVPAPRAAHAAVTLNGRVLGLYVLVEGVDKQFLRRYFADAKGNVYDGHSQSDVNQRMRTNSGETRRDQSRLAALTEAAREPDPDRRWAALAKTLDLDRFISFLAVEVLICHWDGYGLNRNNYRIYHDRQTDRLVFFPQGVDQTFQRQNIAPFPPMQGLVAKAVLDTPQGSERYRARMVELLTNVFQVPALTNHLLEVAARVQPVLEEVDANAANSYSARVGAFRRKIQQRFSSMKRQLLYTTPPQRLESAGALTLAEWEPKAEFGQATLQREKGEDGTAVLHIEAHEESAGSWRSRVELDRGHYRLEGKVRLQGVKLNAEDTKAGAGLRISRRKFARPLSGDLSWTTLGYDFQVTQERAEVELVCELRAEEGQAWFDLASLRLIRKP